MSKTKTNILICSIFIAFAITFGYIIGSFVNTHDFAWHSPILFQSPLTISAHQSTIIVQASDQQDPLTPDQRYGCNKFKSDCVTFLAIMRAESHSNPRALNVNKDGSVDIGCMQINSVHLKQIDTTKINLLNCQQNIDVAYQIFKSWGNWQAWVTYTNGNYKKYLINQ